MKRVLMLAVVIVFCLPGLCLAQLGGLLGKKGNPQVDVEGLSARSAVVMGLVQKANISFAEAVVAVQEAAGKKEAAEKLKQNIANLKSKPDSHNTKVLVSEVNNATADIDKNNVIAQIKADEAQKFMGNSILSVGTGILLDGVAAKNASVLLNDSQAALKQAPFTSAGKIKDVVNVAQFTTQEVPPQATSMKTFSEKLIDYSKSHGIPYPSAEEIAEKAKNVEKE
jgi:hypothetical protein